MRKLAKSLLIILGNVRSVCMYLCANVCSAVFLGIAKGARVIFVAGVGVRVLRATVCVLCLDVRDANRCPANWLCACRSIQLGPP